MKRHTEIIQFETLGEEETMFIEANFNNTICGQNGEDVGILYVHKHCTGNLQIHEHIHLINSSANVINGHRLAAPTGNV